MILLNLYKNKNKKKCKKMKCFLDENAIFTERAFLLLGILLIGQVLETCPPSYILPIQSPFKHAAYDTPNSKIEARMPAARMPYSKIEARMPAARLKQECLQQD